jgi:hypothetical protein
MVIELNNALIILFIVFVHVYGYMYNCKFLCFRYVSHQRVLIQYDIVVGNFTQVTRQINIICCNKLSHKQCIYILLEAD